MSKEELKDEEIEDKESESDESKTSKSDNPSAEKDVKTDTDKDDKEESNKSESQESDEESETDSHDEEDEKTASDETDEGLEEDKTVPYARFKEVNEKYKAVKAEVEALKNVKTIENNNDELNEESVETESNNNAELEKYKTAFNDIFQSRINQVPDEFKELIPEGDDLSKLKWIETAISKGLFDKKIESFGNMGNNPSEQETESNTAFIKNLGRKF